MVNLIDQILLVEYFNFLILFSFNIEDTYLIYLCVVNIVVICLNVMSNDIFALIFP